MPSRGYRRGSDRLSEMPVPHRAETGLPKVAIPVCLMVDTPMGREKKMSSTIRIERIADRLAGFGGHLFNGASLMALNVAIYGSQNGLAGDLFVLATRDFGTNFAILGFSLMMLVTLWGAMLVVYFVIAGLVAIARGIRTLRSAPTPAPQDPVRNANIDTIVAWSNDLDDVTIANICDASIDALSDGYALLAVYQASPRPETLTVVGDIVTVEIVLTVRFADRPPVTVDALLTGNISGRSPGLTNLSRIDRGAA